MVRHEPFFALPVNAAGVTIHQEITKKDIGTQKWRSEPWLFHHLCTEITENGATTPDELREHILRAREATGTEIVCRYNSTNRLLGF